MTTAGPCATANGRLELVDATAVATRPQVICLTPVKDEAWILERFLHCAAQWADHIIIADQGSRDGSDAIARRHPKVRLIINDSPEYDEERRQKLLLDAARGIPGPRLLLALDADEMLTANWSSSPEWQTVLAAPPGTVVRFQWVNVRPDLATCWVPPDDLALGFVDDGSAHAGERIHSHRVPVPPRAPSLVLRDVKVLHYQYTDWERMESKQRWYQCWERVQHPRRRPVSLYRQYHFMHAIPAELARPLRPEWLEGYTRQGIDMTSIRREEPYRWDREVLGLLAAHGAAAFSKIDIWDVDWEERARRDELAVDALGCRDPRSRLERWVHGWLRSTQARCHRPSVRVFQWCLRWLGW